MSVVQLPRNPQERSSCIHNLKLNLCFAFVHRSPLFVVMDLMDNFPLFFVPFRFKGGAGLSLPK